MAEFNKNLWAPWRMDFIRSLHDEQGDRGCFLCRYWETPEDGRANHVLWRGAGAFVVMNRFPYANGHLLIAPRSHCGDLAGVPESELTAMTLMTRDALAVLRRAVNPAGFNVGMNIGHGAGAGLPEHVHTHVVPRWAGDTNYMAVMTDTRIIPQSLDELYGELIAAGAKLGLPARDKP